MQLLVLGEAIITRYYDGDFTQHGIRSPSTSEVESPRFCINYGEARVELGGIKGTPNRTQILGPNVNT